MTDTERPETPWDPIEEYIPSGVGIDTARRSLQPEIFAANLKRQRKSAGLTTDALAARINIRVAALESYESGRYWPPVVHAQMLADALCTTIPVLLGLEDPAGAIDDDIEKLTPGALAVVTSQSVELESLRRSLDMARDSERRWMALAEAVALGIMLHDGNVIVDVNPRFARMFGYDRKDVLGMPLIDFVAPDYRDTVVEHIEAESSRPYEIEGLARTGARMRVRVRARTLKNGLRVAEFKLPRDE